MKSIDAFIDSISVNNRLPVSFHPRTTKSSSSKNRITICTRLVAQESGLILVNWVIAKDSFFRHKIDWGKTYTDKTLNYRIKVNVTNLLPNEKYYYRFICEGISSPVGLTKTLEN